MEKNLFKYIWQHSSQDQIWVLFIVLVSMPFYFLTLNLPKTIVNKAIQGEGFDDPRATAKFLEIVVTPPEFLTSLLGESVTLSPGIDMERVPYLVALSMLFLALVCVNGLFKFYINLFKGRMGERMLRRLRFTLVDRVMRLPTLHFRKVKAPEVATMIKDEVEPLGGFIGDAFVQPLFLGGQAATAMVFIVLQNYLLGTIAVAIVIFQAILIPRLRKRLLVLGKERQLTARELAGRVGEIVEGIVEVHVNDTSNLERAEITSRLGQIYGIRYELYQRKFFVKFVNNFLAQITPFLFYLVGGYFAITGNLDIGQLVAVIAAYKDLPSPIKELIDWDQQRQDVEIKYTQVVNQFEHDGMLDAALQEPVIESVPPLEGDISVSNLTLSDDSGAKLVQNVSFSIGLSDHVAVVGGLNSGAEHVAEALVRLLMPAAGRISIGGVDLAEVSEAVIGRRFAYVGQDVYLRPISIRDNLLYGLMHAPMADPQYDDAGRRARAEQLEEAEATGNTLLDSNADWVDYKSAGVTDRDALEHRIIEVLRSVTMDEDIYRFGLRGTIDPVSQPDLAQSILRVRHAMRERLGSPPLSRLVEPFDASRYNRQATIAENLLFGTAIGKAFESSNLAGNGYVQEILRRTGLDVLLYEMGKSIAKTLVELFADLPPDHPFFEQVDFIGPDDLPLFEAALARVGTTEMSAAAAADQRMFFGLAFHYVEPRHRLALLDEDMQERILVARSAFREGLPDNLRTAIEFYEQDVYNAAASLQDNVLLGRIAYGVAEGPAQIAQAIDQVLTELGLRSAVFEVGLNYNVGTGGKRLNSLQRQKIGLARAILKRPDMIIINRSLAGLDKTSKDQIMDAVISAARDGFGGRRQGLFWVPADMADADRFDRVLVFEDGNVVESGPPSELQDRDSHFARLVAAG
jgi:putative ABC transport system ATP-binding protein